MNEQWPHADDIARLVAVRKRTLELVRGRQWLRQAFQQAFADVQRMCDRRSAECEGERRRELEAARELLVKGEFGDSKSQHPVGRVRFEGLCPASLARQIDGRDPEGLAASVRRRSAAAALAALDRHIVIQSKDTPEEQKSKLFDEEKAAVSAKKYVRFAWTVFPPHLSEWKEPPDPRSLARDDLGALTDADYRAAALYHLGGLADVGAARPLVPQPAETGDLMRDAPAYAAWTARFPIRQGVLGSHEADLSPARLPPELADEMLAVIAEWVQTLESNDDEPPHVQLWRALLGIRSMLDAGGSLFELAERRTQSLRRREQLFESVAGGPFSNLEDAQRAAEVAEHLLDVSVPSERPEYLHHLADSLDEADRFCRNARTAISLKGAKQLEDRISPGTASVSVAWDVRIQAIQEVFRRLHMWLWNPRQSVEEDLAALRDGREWLDNAIREIQAAGQVAEPSEAPSGDEVEFAHSDDFTSIVWCGHPFQLSKGQQAKAMQMLWSAWEAGGRKDGFGLSEGTIGERLGTSNDRFRLIHVFRKRSGLWGCVIRPSVKGAFALYRIEPPTK